MEDFVGQLRRQIAQATTEKEAAKIDLEALKRTVDSHLLRLNSVLGGTSVPFDRVVGAIQAFDADLKGRLDTDDSNLRDGLPSEGTYEVLRHSLTDAQRRCQELNSDMLRVADSNEELMGTLKTLKGTNKRLVEEVQKQTEELSSLTQQRILDMENLTRLEDAFRAEKAMWQQEAQRTIEEEQHHCDEEFRKMKHTLTAQLDECWRRAKMVASKASTLKTMQSQLKTEVQGFSQNVGMNLKKLERELLDKIAASAKQMHGEQYRLKDIEHNLQVKLRAEREVRENETEAWRARHKALAEELEDLVARRDKEVSELQTKIEAINSTRDVEANSVATERARLHEQVESHVKEVALLEAMMQTARRKVMQLESRMSQSEGERERLQATADTLRQQIRESDEALSEALRSNEALREQMEVQRLDAHNTNERDLKLCREMFERRLDQSAHGHQSEQADLAKRIRALEEAMGMKAGELQAGKETLSLKTRQRDSLQRDVLMWKAQHELAVKMKADVEREYMQFKQESLKGELIRKQEQYDELATRKAELELKRGQLVDEASQVQEAVKAREEADTERSKAIATEQAEVDRTLQSYRAQLAEVEASLASVKAEAATMTQQMSEKRDGLEQDIARIQSELEAEKRDFERKIHAERSSCESLRDSVDKLRTDHRSSYKAALDGPVQQIYALEGAISDIQRSSDAELAGLRQKSEKLRQRGEELEVELARTQAKLEQTEREVQDATMRVSQQKANHRGSREAWERERVLKAEELQQVHRSITQKSEQLRALSRSGEDARKRMLRDVEEAKTAKATQLTEADRRLNQLRSEYSYALEDVGAGAGGFNTSRERRHVGTPASVQEIAGQVQRSLTSMEERAAELRRGHTSR